MKVLQVHRGLYYTRVSGIGILVAMMESRHYACLLLGLIVVGVAAVTQVGYSTTHYSLEVSLSLSADPIVITSDSGFSALGFPGSGTQGDPYRIENLDIDGLGGSCITISGTTVYFRIENCNFHDGHYAMDLQNLENGEILWNNFTDNFLAVIIDDCTSMNFHHNQLVANSRGFWCNNTSWLYIDYNNITNTSGGYGVAFNLCSDTSTNAARWNNISGCGNGVLIQWSYWCYIIGNTITGSTYGIYSHSGQQCRVRGNYLGHNSASNAKDDGTDNEWDQDEHLGGNYWDDYVSGAQYSILGSAGAKDNYPRSWPLDNPMIDSPSDVVYSRGETGFSITWIPSDVHPSYYRVYRNDSEVYDGPWDGSSISTSVDGLIPSIYNYTLFVEDLGGNWASDTAFVTVLRDSTSPSIGHPSDILFTEGQTGFGLSWSVSDSNPYVYCILKNGTAVESDAWTSQVIGMSLENLAPGVYNYTLEVEDMDNNTARDSVMVRVQVDSEAPVLLNNPKTVSYVFGVTGEQITWTYSDLNPSSYIISVNGTVQEGYPQSWYGASIIYSVEGWNVGVYQVTIEIYDKNDNLATSTVIVTVSEIPVPVIIFNLYLFTLVGGGLGIIGTVYALWRRVRHKNA